ncbi:Protein of unknown function DUF2003 [Phytophthora cactorum]|nr:Protein of unknown function DUF2003 [Phytophthora cactorum]
MSVGSSPVALTPNFSSLSPLYPLPGSPHSAGSSPCSTSMDDAVGRLFTQYLPTFFDLLEKFQYQKALLIVEDEEETRWKSWGAVKVMLKLGASCESTYHLMKYVEAELVQTDTIDQMYGKLVVLMNHLADELKPIVARQSRHFSVHTPTPSSTRNGNASGSRDGEKECENDSMLMMEIAMCGDMSYYVELLEQGAEFFSVNAETTGNLLLRFDTFDHPLLETMKQSAIEELSTVHAAIQCEARVAEYDFTRSIVALHRLKVQLRSWSDHIDGVSDYPLFEGNGIDFGAGGEEEGLLLDESNEHYGITSDSMYSNTIVCATGWGGVCIAYSTWTRSEARRPVPQRGRCELIYANYHSGASHLGWRKWYGRKWRWCRYISWNAECFKWWRYLVEAVLSFLVAKFSLYFHCWLEPFEKKTDYLTLELSRFIKTPLGISYLGLMDVLLSRGSQRGDGSIIRVMLILETQALENKGAHYYENGYRCPSSSNALYTRTDQEKQDEQEEQEAKQKAIASAGSANTSGVSSRTHSPASSRGEERRRQMDILAGSILLSGRLVTPTGSLAEHCQSHHGQSILAGLGSPCLFALRTAAEDNVSHLKGDEAMYLVLLAEGVKKSNEKVAQAKNLQHSGAFAPRVLATVESSSA